MISQFYHYSYFKNTEYEGYLGRVNINKDPVDGRKEGVFATQ